MITLVYIGLMGVFAYHCLEINRNFRGSSYKVKLLMGLSGGIGYSLYYAFLIWSFWHFSWYQPIITGFASMIVGSITAIFFQKKLVGMMLSPLLLVAFTVLSFIGLIN